MPRAYDLVGNISAPAEVFPRLDALEKMAATLRERGLHDAADDTEALVEEARAFAATMCSRTSRLHGLWKAIETASGPVQDPAAATRKITAAALAYRAVKEQGTRRD
jgi:hypothetical protein